MAKRNIRIAVDRSGMVFIDDLSPLEVDLLKKLGTSCHSTLDSFPTAIHKPRYVSLKDFQLRYSLPHTLEPLLRIHQEVISGPSSNSELIIKTKKGKAELVTVFDLKRAIFAKYLKNCALCGHRCGGKRVEQALCPVSRPARYHQYFVHLGEEVEIGTTMVIELTGCNMECVFCQKGNLIHTEEGFLLDRKLWGYLEKEYKMNSFFNLSFLGGNPDQSFLGVLGFLESAPLWAQKFPIVWHTNGYSTPEFYDLLSGLVDLWVIDFKYFSDECAVELSGAPNYTETAKIALQKICSLSKDTPVLVRHLILPGHWECCQKPLMEWLCGHRSEIIFHPMAQYRPHWKVRDDYGTLSSPLKREEFEAVKHRAEEKGLSLTIPN